MPTVRFAEFFNTPWWQAAEVSPDDIVTYNVIRYGLVTMITDRKTLYYEYHCGDPLDSLDDQLTAIGDAFAADHPWEQHVGSWAVRLLLKWLARPA